MMQIEQQYLNLNGVRLNQPPETTVPPPPVIICPTEVDSVNITLEKNQQCACKDCGKLFNSVWYLKQHAVKHSNDRPFRCKFCYKTYKFRSNLYQHKCPDRIKNGNSAFNKRLMCRFTVNQPHLFESRPSSIQQAQQGLIPNEIGRFFSNDSDSFSPLKPSEESVERIRDPGETIIPEAGTEKQQIELREVIPKRLLEQAVIENYLQKYKHKLYQCRKCKLQFPTRGYLSRHTAQHNELDQLSLQCELCPQRFFTDIELKKHAELHSKDCGVLCIKCCAPFRSMLALRRHRNQCLQCELSLTSDSYDSQTFDEYAYIDVKEAETEMGTTTNGNGKEKLSSSEEDVGCSYTNSSTGCYEPLPASPARATSGSNENGSPSCEYSTKRNVTTVKIKLGSTSVVSILKKKDKSNNDEQPVCRDRISYAELGTMERTGSEAALAGEQRRRLSLSSAFDAPTNGHENYGSYVHSGHTSNHAGVGGNGPSGSTQTNGGAGSETHFGSTFEMFEWSSSSEDAHEGLVLRGGRPVLLHTHTHPAKGQAECRPIVDLINWTAQSLRDEICLCEALCAVRTHLLRTVAVYAVYSTVLHIVAGHLDYIFGEHKRLNWSLFGLAASTAATPAAVASSSEVVTSTDYPPQTVAGKETSRADCQEGNAASCGPSADDKCCF